MTRLSISDLLPYLACEYRGHTRFTQQRWLAPSDPQRLGTWLHALCAWILCDENPDSDWAPTPPEDLLALAAPLAEAAREQLYDRTPFRVHWVEQALGLQIAPELTLEVRPDGLVTYQDSLLDLQWKTAGKGRDISRLMSEVVNSPHEIAYRHILRQHGNDVQGTLLGVFRTYLTKQQKADNVPILEFFPLYASAEEDATRFHQDLVPKAIALANSRLSGAVTYKNWSACFSLTGACPLVPHCHQGAAIEDCLPQPLEDRYADRAADPAA